MSMLEHDTQHARDRAFAFATMGTMLLLYQAPPVVRNAAAVSALVAAGVYWAKHRHGRKLLSQLREIL